MKKPIYKKELHKNSLVFEQEWADNHTFFQMQMLTENDIEGLLPCSISTFNGEKQLLYDITGRQTLDCVYEKKQLDDSDIEIILNGLKRTLLQMQKYLLDEDYLLLSPEYIYIDLSTKELFFCFYPFEKEAFTKKLETFAEYILEHINHEKKETVVIAYQFYRSVKEENKFFFQIMEELYPLHEEAEELIAVEEPFHSEEIAEIREENICEKKTDKKPKGLYYLASGCMLAGLAYGLYYYYVYFADRQRTWQEFFSTVYGMSALFLIALGVVFWVFSFYFYKVIRKQQKNEQNIITDLEHNKDSEYSDDKRGLEETYYYEEAVSNENELENNRMEMTVLLSENCYKEERCLVSADRRKIQIKLTDFPFTIGKMPDVVDYVLEDKSVSRMHVKFTYNAEEDTVYMQDLNSTNGTYHNGIRLEDNEKVPVYADDEIKIGRRVFVYQ